MEPKFVSKHTPKNGKCKAAYEKSFQEKLAQFKKNGKFVKKSKKKIDGRRDRWKKE